MFKNIDLNKLTKNELQILFNAVDDFYWKNEHNNNYDDDWRREMNRFSDKIIDVKNSKTNL